VEEPEKIRFGFWTSKYDDKNMTGRFEHDVPCSCGRSTAWKYTLNVYPAKGGEAMFDTVVTPVQVGKEKRSAQHASPSESVNAVGFPMPRQVPGQPLRVARHGPSSEISGASDLDLLCREPGCGRPRMAKTSATCSVHRPQVPRR